VKDEIGGHIASHTHSWKGLQASMTMSLSCFLEPLASFAAAVNGYGGSVKTPSPRPGSAYRIVDIGFIRAVEQLIVTTLGA
jgi:hypothetical protein